MTVPDSIRMTLSLPADADWQDVLDKVDAMHARRHERLLDAAVNDGRLVEASRPRWRAALRARGPAAERELAALASSRGSGESAPRIPHDELMARAFGADKANSRRQ